MYGWSRECNLCGYQYVQTCTNIQVHVYVHVDPIKIGVGQHRYPSDKIVIFFFSFK